MLAQAQAMDEVDWLAEKHFQYFSQLASTAADHLRKADAGKWLRKLDLSVDDLHAALDRAIAEGRPEALSMAVDLVFFWDLRWMPGEGAKRLSRALEIEGIPASMRAHGLAALSRMKLGMGDQEGARQQATAALELARSAGDHKAQFASLILLANTHLSDPARALDEAREAVKIAGELGDEALVAVALGSEALALLLTGKMQESRAKLEECLDRARRIGAKKTVAEVLNQLADLLSLSDPVDIGLAYSDEQERLGEELGHRDAQAWSKIHRVGMLGEAARSFEAVEAAMKAVAFANQSPLPRLQLLSLRAASRAFADVGDFAQAQTYAERAAGIARRIGSALIADGCLALVRVSRLLGNLQDAIHSADEAVAAVRQIGDEYQLSSALSEQGRVLADAGNFDAARRAFEEASRIAGANLKGPGWSSLPLYEAEAAFLEGRLDEAEHMYAEIEKSKIPPDVGESLIYTSRIRRAKSDPVGAGEAILRGVDVLVSFGWRRLALEGLEEGASVLQAMGRDGAAVEVLAWAAALRVQTGSVVYPKDLSMLEELHEKLGVVPNTPPAIPVTGVLEIDLERAVAALRQGLEDRSGWTGPVERKGRR